MPKWNIIYNGFGSQVSGLGGVPGATSRWNHVKVQTQRSVPVYSTDGVSIETMRHTITGTALITSDTEANFNTTLKNARNALTKAPAKNKGLEIYISADGTTPDSGVEFATSDVTDGIVTATQTHSYTGVFQDNSMSVIYSGSNEDDYGLPICEFTINEIKGTLTAIVGFTITWHKYEPPSGAGAFDVLSHVWSQEHEISRRGLARITITGQLRVKNFTTDDGQGLGGTDATRGTDPDRYRSLVMPVIPFNFRLENMRWATDTAGTTLNYTVTLQEHARPLPAPAKDGSGSFSYRRTNTGPGYRGIKTFQGELEGDGSSNPGQLLASLIDCASTRISFGGANVDDPIDQIVSLEVTESDIFSRRRIGLKVVALGMQVTDPIGEGPGGPDPGFNVLGSFFTEDHLNSSPPNEYGNRLIKSVKRQLFIPYDPSTNNEYSTTNFPQALMADATTFSADSSDYMVDEIVTVDDTGGVPDGYESEGNIDETKHSEQPYTMVSGKESVQIDNNYRVVSGCGLYSPDMVYQIGKPKVFLVSEYVMSRMNKPPTKFLLTKPNNGLITEQSFDIERGPIDANNNREYRGVFRRVVRILDDGANTDGWGIDSSVVIPGWGLIYTRSWWPPNNLGLPVDARIEGSDQSSGTVTRTLFSSGENEPNYKIGP